jgi:hypothetical protein
VSGGVAKVLQSADGGRRVLIVERSDGNFGLMVFADGCHPLPAHVSIFQTIEIAEREARAWFPWLS